MKKFLKHIWYLNFNFILRLENIWLPSRRLKKYRRVILPTDYYAGKVIIILLFLSIRSFSQVPISSTTPNQYSFTLPTNETVVSAGVFQNNILKRILFSNRSYSIGKHTESWDGRDDYGNLLTYGGTYQIKIIANNNAYSWLGVIGNSSDSLSGNNVWRGNTPIADLVQTGSYMRGCFAFSELNRARFKFNPSLPNQEIRYGSVQNLTEQQTFFTCSDGVNIYWAGKEYNRNRNFIFGETIANDAIESIFSRGISFTPTIGRTYNSVIDLDTNRITGIVTGLTAQQSGHHYLFVAHRLKNIIRVFDMSLGGGLVQTISITSPGNLCLENDNTLWVAQSTTVTKYIVNSNGTITPTSSQITGLSRPCGISILSGDLCILDGGNQQIVKRYNSTTLSSTGTIGRLGGYATSPTVYNDKFYLEDLQGQYFAFVRHQSDGSIWIGDPGNCRIQHFSSSGTFIASIQYIPLNRAEIDGVTNVSQTYAVNICHNQNTQIFSNFSEYTVGYPNPTSGWTLINNYGYNYPQGWELSQPVTDVALLYGHRFMIIQSTLPPYTHIAELTSTGLRITPNSIPQHTSMDDVGNLTVTNTTGGTIQTVTYTRYMIKGLDGSNNPIYSSPAVKTAISLGYDGPRPFGGWLVTTSGKLILLNPFVNAPRGGFPLYHLAGYDTLSSTMQFKTLKSTSTIYTGDFPYNEIADQGNSVIYPFGSAAISGNNIVINYHGENYRSGQTAITYVFDESGLFKGCYGILESQLPTNVIAPLGYFTNSQWTNITSYGGNLYGYFADESAHCGIAVTKIIPQNEYSQTINLVLSNRILSIPTNKTDLLKGLLENNKVQGSINWSQVPTSDIPSGGTNYFYTHTRQSIYDLTQSPDVQINVKGQNVGPYNLTRTLPSVGRSNWTISGNLKLDRVSFTGSEGAGHSKVYMAITDGAGKDIVRLYFYQTNRIGFNNVFYGPYNQPKYNSSDFIIKRNGTGVYLHINLFGNIIDVTQPMYDSTATITNPATISWNFIFDPSSNSNTQIGINKLYWVQ